MEKEQKSIFIKDWKKIKKMELLSLLIIILISLALIVSVIINFVIWFILKNKRKIIACNLNKNENTQKNDKINEVVNPTEERIDFDSEEGKHNFDIGNHIFRYYICNLCNFYFRI